MIYLMKQQLEETKLLQVSKHVHYFSWWSCCLVN